MKDFSSNQISDVETRFRSNLIDNQMSPCTVKSTSMSHQNYQNWAIKVFLKRKKSSKPNQKVKITNPHTRS